MCYSTSLVRIFYRDSHSHGKAKKSKIVCMSLAYAQQRTLDTTMLAIFSATFIFRNSLV